MNEPSPEENAFAEVKPQPDPPPFKSFVFKNEFKYISGIKNTFSETLQIYNTSWSIMLWKPEKGQKRLEVLLCCQNNPGSIETRVELKLTLSKDESSVKSFNHTFTSSSVVKDGIMYRGWDELLAKLEDNKLMVEARVDIIKFDGYKRNVINSFGLAIQNETNVALVVENQTFHVSKQFLATQSIDFKKMFFDTEPGCMEYFIKDVSAEDFQVFLDFLYHADPSYDFEDLESVLRLAQKFKMQNILKEVEYHILSPGHFKIPEFCLLELANNYNLDKLKARCLDRLGGSIKSEAENKTEEQPIPANVAARTVRGSNKRPAGVCPHPSIDKLRDEQRTVCYPLCFNITTRMKNVQEEGPSTEGQEFFGLTWEPCIYQRNGFAVFYLHCERTNCTGQIWIIKARISFQITSVTGESIVRTFSTRFNSIDTVQEFPNIMKWDVFQADYVFKNEIEFKTKVDFVKLSGFEREIIEPTGWLLGANSWNAVLNVEDKKFYIGKEIFMTLSPVMKVLFGGNSFKEARMMEKKLTSKSKDFGNLLRFIHHEEVLNDDTVAGIAELADMLLMDRIKNKCATFLMRQSFIIKKHKLKIAIVFNLEKLKNSIIEDTTTPFQLEHCMDPDIEQWDPSLYALFQNKLNSFSQ